MGGSGVLKLAVVTPAKWYRFWWCDVIEQLVTQRDHHECLPRFPRPGRSGGPRGKVGAHRRTAWANPMLTLQQYSQTKTEYPEEPCLGSASMGTLLWPH